MECIDLSMLPDEIDLTSLPDEVDLTNLPDEVELTTDEESEEPSRIVCELLEDIVDKVVVRANKKRRRTLPESSDEED